MASTLVDALDILESLKLLGLFGLLVLAGLLVLVGFLELLGLLWLLGLLRLCETKGWAISNTNLLVSEPKFTGYLVTRLRLRFSAFNNPHKTTNPRS